MEEFPGLSKSVLVTGAAAGIGRSITQSLVDRGTRVVAFDSDPDGLDALAGEFGGDVDPHRVDLRDDAAVHSAVAAAWGSSGPIDGLVNCAGVYPVTPLLDLEVEEWDRVVSLNLRAPFLMSRDVARLMRDHGVEGRIVNITSTAGVLCRPGVAHYGSTKAGLNQLTRNLAIELAPHGIRVNAVAPGLVATETVMAHAAAAGAAEHAAKLARIPLGREARPSEIVPPVLFLLSEASSYCTGTILLADGGVTLGIPSY